MRSVRRWFRELGSSHAERQGIRLLRQWLTPAQLAQFEACNYFDVRGCHSKKRYRIRHGPTTNIWELDDQGRKIARWCFVPDGGLVAGDVMLAQKIALETNEKDALGLAHRFSPF
jgi:hypothetical protein